MGNVAEQRAWAIHTRSPEGHDFLGRYWRFGDEQPPPGVLQTRLFETRAQARKALEAYRAAPYVPWPKARVVRVNIRVEEAQDGWVESTTSFQTRRCPHEQRP